MENNITDRAKGFVKDFFLNLTTFVALYWLTISFIVLLFEIINTVFKDTSLHSYGSQSISTFSLSSIIVLTPVFFYFAYKTNKEIQKDNSKKDLWIRRWLIYLTIFIAGGSIIGDGIVLINIFLNGDLTTRFLLKVLVMVLVPGFVFWYLKYLLTRDYSVSPYNKNIAILTIVVIISTVIGAFFVVGSPVQNRLERVDQERISNLTFIQNQIISYWQQTGELPESLDVLVDKINYIEIPDDPETNLEYKYIKEGDLTFSLCANFKTQSTKESLAKEAPYGYIESTWEHEIGENCFKRNIDPKRHSLKPII